MRVGLPTTNVETAVADARQTKGLGIDYVACDEHLFFEGPTTNAFIQLAVAAGATDRIRLVSSLTLFRCTRPRWSRRWPSV